MALALDASTPAFVTGTSNPATTASFTPPDGSLLFAICEADESNTFSVSGGSLTWTSVGVNINQAGQGSLAAFWAYADTSPGSMTVASTRTGSFTAHAIKVLVFTGAETAFTGAKLTGLTATVNLTTTADNSWVWAGHIEEGGGADPAATGCTFNDAEVSFGGIGGGILKRTANTPTSGTVVNIGVSSSTLPAILAIEVKESGTVALGRRSTSRHPGRGPSRTARFYTSPRSTATSTVTATAEQGNAATGVTATGAATKIAVSRGPATVGVTTAGTARKVAAVSGICSVGIGGTGQAAKRAPVAGPAAVGVAGVGTAAKKTGQAGTVSVGVAATRTGVAVHAQGGRAAWGTAVSGVAAKRAPAAGTASVGVAGTRSGLIVRAVSGVCTIAVSGLGTARKAVAVSGVAAVGIPATGADAKRAVLVGSSAFGSVARGIAVKRAPAAGRALLGVVLLGGATKTALPRGTATLGVFLSYLAVVPEPLETPPERTVSTPAESRTVVTQAEDRTAVVAAEDRTVEA